MKNRDEGDSSEAVASSDKKSRIAIEEFFAGS